MLSDVEILERLCVSGPDALIVTPIISARQIQSASIDLRLGFHFMTLRSPGIAALDPLAKTRDELTEETKRYSTEMQLSPGDPFFIHPGEFALGTTFEYVRLPTDLAASLEGRSSLGRLGITVHSTAGFIDPGFRGRITYEVQNEGTRPVALYPGMRVAQLCFIKLGTRALRAYGKRDVGSKYVQQLSTTASHWYMDEEIDALHRLRRRFAQPLRKDVKE